MKTLSVIILGVDKDFITVEGHQVGVNQNRIMQFDKNLFKNQDEIKAGRTARIDTHNDIPLKIYDIQKIHIDVNKLKKAML